MKEVVCILTNTILMNQNLPIFTLKKVLLTVAIENSVFKNIFKEHLN